MLVLMVELVSGVDRITNTHYIYYVKVRRDVSG